MATSTQRQCFPFEPVVKEQTTLTCCRDKPPARCFVRYVGLLSIGQGAPCLQVASAKFFTLPSLFHRSERVWNGMQYTVEMPDLGLEAAVLERSSHNFSVRHC